MFNWIKRNLSDPLQATESNVEVTPKPLSTPPPPEGVSEPVLSFVKLVRENPENFLIKPSSKDGYGCYKLIDKKNRQRYIFTLAGYRWIHVEGLSFLTDVERELLYVLYEEMGRRYVENEKRKQRQKYIDIYCKG